MKEKFIHVCFVIDESGSMSGSENDVVGGFKKVIDEQKAVKEGIEYAILDIGMQNPKRGGVLFATVAGMSDAGVEIPFGEGVLPEEDRLNGAHIDESIAALVAAVKEKMEAE